MAKLTVENYCHKITVEDIEHEDLNFNDWARMFATLMIGVGFLPRTVYSGMKEFAEEYLETE